ncbi:MAG: NUDIX domain-containing protein [bacterium]
MTSYLTLIRQQIGHHKIPLLFASACVLDEMGRVLWQHRTDFNRWGLPGGILELEESLPECVAREVYEESGLEVEPKELVGVYSSPDFDVFYPNNDRVHQVTACFTCHVVGGNLRIDNDETLNLEWFPQDTPPPTFPWYRAMANDLLLHEDSPSFDRGSPGNRECDKPFFEILQERLNETPLILPIATAFIQDGKKRVVLLHNNVQDVWELPGGYLHAGERIDQTVIYEVRKKTGLVIQPIRLMGIYSDSPLFGISPYGTRCKLVNFVFQCAIIQGKIEGEGTTQSHARFFSQDAIAPLSTASHCHLQHILTHQDKVFF